MMFPMPVAQANTSPARKPQAADTIEKPMTSSGKRPMKSPAKATCRFNSARVLSGTMREKRAPSHRTTGSTDAQPGTFSRARLRFNPRNPSRRPSSGGADAAA